MSVSRYTTELGSCVILLQVIGLTMSCGDISKVKTRSWSAPSLCGRSSLRILPLGDSFVAGYDVFGHDFGGTNGAFRTLMWSKLQNQMPDVEIVGQRTDGPSLYPTAALHHQGLPGWTVGKLVDGGGPSLTPAVDGSLTTWLADANPDIVVMIPGPDDLWRLNDGRKAYAEWVAAHEVTRLIEAVATAAPNAYILVGNHPPVAIPGQGDEGWLQLVRWFNSELVNVAAERYDAGAGRVRFLDLFSQLDRNTDLASDGGHPNAGGYERISWALV